MAGFVKLDCGILDSTVWLDRDVRDVFLTALLMAQPHELVDPAPQLQIRALEPTGWTVPAGWYGLARAASTAIIQRAGVHLDVGLTALERMGEPEAESRSQNHGGRRLARIDGGFVVLNYQRHRDHDYTAAERMRAMRARRRAASVTRNHRHVHPNVTQAEAEADQLQLQEHLSIAARSTSATGENAQAGPGAIVSTPDAPEAHREATRVNPGHHGAITATPAAGLRPDCVMQLWNELLPVRTRGGRVPTVTSLRGQRLLHLNARLQEPARDEAWWRAYFAKIAASPFLRGERTGWCVTFDFAVESEANVAKVLDGNYDGDDAAPGQAPAPADYRPPERKVTR